MIFKFGLQGKAYFKFDSSSSLALRSPDFRKRSGASSAQPDILCLFFFFVVLWPHFRPFLYRDRKMYC